ncbi:MAG: DUF559 domain-containing protein [Chloroflexota bacterium]|nr:MAG: DUF559 domain-containing protein [Chloroflexota bacterium]
MLDFYCSDRRLVVEADGGHHFDLDRQVADAERTRYLEGRGLRVLRFTKHRDLGGAELGASGDR